MLRARGLHAQQSGHGGGEGPTSRGCRQAKTDAAWDSRLMPLERRRPCSAQSRSGSTRSTRCWTNRSRARPESRIVPPPLGMQHTGRSPAAMAARAPRPFLQTTEAASVGCEIEARLLPWISSSQSANDAGVAFPKRSNPPATGARTRSRWPPWRSLADVAIEPVVEPPLLGRQILSQCRGRPRLKVDAAARETDLSLEGSGRRKSALAANYSP